MNTGDAQMERAGVEAWVIGFLSGASAYGNKNAIKGMIATDILSYVDDYCTAHSKGNMVNAATAFIDIRR